MNSSSSAINRLKSSFKKKTGRGIEKPGGYMGRNVRYQRGAEGKGEERNSGFEKHYG